MASDLTKRIAFAAAAIPAAVALAYLGGWWLAGLLAAAGALGSRELYSLARAQGIEPFSRLGMVGAALAPLLVGWPMLAPGAAAPLGPAEGFTLWLLAVMVAALFRRVPRSDGAEGGGHPLAAVAVTVLGALYAGWLLSFALLLRHPLPAPAGEPAVGMALLCYPLALTWLGDTAAMVGGRTFGGPRLAPLVSPHKTWAGGLAGLFASTAASVIYAALAFRRVGISMSLGEAVGFGVLISVAGQLGDATESLFKREAGVKDSSTLIPGHGGVLDRLDALYFAVPVTALLFFARGLI